MLLVEQIPESPELEHLAPPSLAVLLPVVEHVTPLTERREVTGPVVAGVVIQMRAGQNHAGDRQTWGRGDASEIALSGLEHLGRGKLSHSPAAAIAPGATLSVPTGTIA
jgi:hypothetical protein